MYFFKMSVQSKYVSLSLHNELNQTKTARDTGIDVRDHCLTPDWVYDTLKGIKLDDKLTYYRIANVIDGDQTLAEAASFL